MNTKTTAHRSASRGTSRVGEVTACLYSLLMTGTEHAPDYLSVDLFVARQVIPVRS